MDYGHDDHKKFDSTQHHAPQRGDEAGRRWWRPLCAHVVAGGFLGILVWAVMEAPFRPFMTGGEFAIPYIGIVPGGMIGLTVFLYRQKP